MKKVLLTTTALVAFAGAAAAEVTFGGEVTVGYNDVIENGLYVEGSLDITGTADFGDVSVSVSYGLDLYDGSFDDFPTITITSPWATLTVGDVEYAAVDMFASVDGMAFGVIDQVTFRERNAEIVARVDATFGGISVGVAIDAFDDDYNSNDVSVGVAGEFGGFRFTAAFDQVGMHDANGSNASGDYFGVSAGTTFGGFDVDVAYMTETHNDTNSLGVAVGGTFGGVDVGGYYAINSAAADAYGVSVGGTFGAAVVSAYWDGDSNSNSNFGVDVEYAVNDMISAFAGWDEADGFYAYGTMAVGDAEVGAGFAEYDEAGPAEIKEGMSIWMTLPF